MFCYVLANLTQFYWGLVLFLLSATKLVSFWVFFSIDFVYVIYYNKNVLKTNIYMNNRDNINKLKSSLDTNTFMLNSNIL